MPSTNANYESVDDLPGALPVFPLTGALLLPRAQLPLNIFEPRYLAMVDSALAGERLIGMVQPSFSGYGDPVGNLCKVGCAGRIVSFTETGDGRYLITLGGISRFSIAKELETTTLFRQVVPDWTTHAKDLSELQNKEDVDREKLLETLETYLQANDLEANWNGIQEADTELIVNALSIMSPFGEAEKQALLEANTLKERADILVAITEFSLVQNQTGGDAILQ